MRAIMLDRGSLDNNDLDFTQLEALPIQWTFHHNTKPDEVFQRIQHADIIVTNKVIISAQDIANSSCQLICAAATGVNNIAIDAASDYNIPVCNIRGYATPAVVQHTFALLLALTNNLFAYQTSIRNGKWQQCEFFSFFSHTITELAGKTIGIIGYGELGRAVASLADALGMHVLVAESFINKNNPSRTKLEKIFTDSDVVSLHCPLTAETRHIINTESLALMKSTAFLINTSRGELVDETALEQALVSRRIAGAGLDVLQNEPPDETNVLLKLDMPNLIITPHIAWATQASRQRLLNELVLNIREFLSGKIRNQVNELKSM